MYSCSSAVVVLHLSQIEEVLISLAGGEGGRGGHDLFSGGSLLGWAAPGARAGGAKLQATANFSCCMVYSTCSLVIITTQIRHGKQGQSSTLTGV
jgi:hypothetical protein